MSAKSFPLKGETFQDYVDCILANLPGANVYTPAPNLVLFCTRRDTIYLGKGKNWQAQARRVLRQIRGY